MIRLSTDIRGIKYVACSGGVDSMALLYFVRQSNKDVVCAFYHHATKDSDNAMSFLRRYCSDNDIKMNVGFLVDQIPKGVSKEAFWRMHRYRFLLSLDGIVATAHHLNDVAETYIASTIRGDNRLIKPEFKNIRRPLLNVTKDVLIRWCKAKKIPYIHDKSNDDLSFDRNRIRHKVIPEILKVYPGFFTTIRKMQNKRWSKSSV